MGSKVHGYQFVNNRLSNTLTPQYRTTMSPTRLRTEYRENPLGLDVPRPRLYWQVADDTQGARQTAYQIQAGSACCEDDLWDTGKVDSNQTIHVPYEGAVPAGDFQRIWWRVKVWDQNGNESGWSEPAYFETGVTNWSAQWIQDLTLGGPRTTAPCPYFRKEISLRGEVKDARLAITALGVYEAWINGQRVGDLYLEPGWTDYNKRVQYQVYDVTGMLQPGDNAVGAILGDGWYCGNVEWRGRQRVGRSADCAR